MADLLGKGAESSSSRHTIPDVGHGPVGHELDTERC